MRERCKGADECAEAAEGQTDVRTVRRGTWMCSRGADEYADATEVQTDVRTLRKGI